MFFSLRFIGYLKILGVFDSAGLVLATDCLLLVKLTYNSFPPKVESPIPSKVINYSPGSP